MELNIGAVSNQKFDFIWGSPMNSTDVEVTLPDLSKLEYSVWGDWGPMYKFNLTDQAVVKIKYNEDEYNSSQKQLKIESPMLARERDELPFYIIIEDQSKNLKFKLYIDTDYNLAKVTEHRIRNNAYTYEEASENSQITTL